MRCVIYCVLERTSGVLKIGTQVYQKLANYFHHQAYLPLCPYCQTVG